MELDLDSIASILDSQFGLFFVAFSLFLWFFFLSFRSFIGSFFFGSLLTFPSPPSSSSSSSSTFQLLWRPSESPIYAYLPAMIVNNAAERM